MPEQLPLPFAFNAEQGFEQFHAGGNEETVAHLRRAARGAEELLIYVWGGESMGKSHLLQACCQEAYRSGQTVSYLPLRTLLGYGSEVLDGLEHQDLVCLDDIDVLMGKVEWEHALFRLFNRLRDAKHRLIVSATVPPAEMAVDLPDLKTRLGWGLTLMLRPLSDEDRLAALSLQARSLGLDLPPPVGRFLLAHYRRDLASLRQLLEHLDRASLAAKRKLTVPFLKTYLEETL
ncbi:MAG: hda [Proteobacteria bacterium]|nr:hda [Pseudomonadota bacterium]